MFTHLFKHGFFCIHWCLLLVLHLAYLTLVVAALINLEIQRLHFSAFQAVSLTTQVHLLIALVDHLQLDVLLGVPLNVKLLCFREHLHALQGVEALGQGVGVDDVLVVLLGLGLFEFFKVLELHALEELSEVQHEGHVLVDHRLDFIYGLRGFIVSFIIGEISLSLNFKLGLASDFRHAFHGIVLILIHSTICL